ncbi:hypothetical protein BW723_06940 [Polaribacter reichenbachii]|uniref:VOC domain-containing protein n=1 Tax=Polaribacter reichenbachii TaxID=996801 RepID=A0A1B8U5U9_9FLAO|nr:VOC family protein [Polaribacter reichenbachii]APZ46047.1 hypothetical protein BW723_06940 [Polaribacter reichenbachii]AUC19909.1 hypothetical protein BTO17_14960 [Polaribacter reichenbachii]OBY67236.1 hypothetical protein LPB301_02550 [Polaribacter reichenbachii]
MTEKPKYQKKFASFGAIHLNNTSLTRSTHFWTKIVGMKLRVSNDLYAEFGTTKKTLVVVHQSAKTRFLKGYSGLYHFAIHVPTQIAFANMLQRLLVYNYPYSPIDHTMSKSIYLEDPDGITIELTLETPERFLRVVSDRSIAIEDSFGNIKSASEYLDVKSILKDVTDTAANLPIDENAYLGHLHLYANNLENSHLFYKDIGFNTFNYLHQFMYADLGAGGDYKHRIALNCWHGINKPLAPNSSAGMRHFHIKFNSEERLKNALNKLSSYEEKGDKYLCKDATGNVLLLSKEKV